MLHFDQGLRYSDSVQLTWEMIFSNEYNLEIAIDNVRQTGSA